MIALKTGTTAGNDSRELPKTETTSILFRRAAKDRDNCRNGFRSRQRRGFRIAGQLQKTGITAGNDSGYHYRQGQLQEIIKESYK
jgi:hypothetical protein